MHHQIFAALLCSALLLAAAPVAAQSRPDEPGLSPSRSVADSDDPAASSRPRRGAHHRAAQTPQSAYNHGFHVGLGVSGILAGPQIIAWGVPFYYATSQVLDEADCKGSGCTGWEVFAGIGATSTLFVAILSTVWGVASTSAGVYLVATHRQGRLPTVRMRRASRAGFAKGLGLGLVATGVLNVTMGTMFVTTELYKGWGDDDAGYAISLALLIAGGVELLGGGVLAITGHMAGQDAMQRVSLAPSVWPGGGGLVLGGRW